MLVKNIIDEQGALKLARTLQQKFGLPQLGLNTLHSNPSVNKFSKTIKRLLDHQKSSDSIAAQLRRQKMEGLLERYQSLVDEITTSESTRLQSDLPGSAPLEGGGQVIVLTGSTGSLGSFILRVLLETSSVLHVYCLNRSEDSQSLQYQRNKSKVLPTRFPSSKVTFLTANFTKPRLGLDKEIYSKLCVEATHIIHTAWQVNFLLSLQAFHPHILGLIRLVAFASTCAHAPSLLFFSTIASVQSPTTGTMSTQTSIPEIIIRNAIAPLPYGYAESKFHAEMILDYSARKFPRINFSIARIGQIAGQTVAPGFWNRQERFPSLVVSSRKLAMIPDVLRGGSQK